MPYIELESHLPGITGLLEYRKDTAEPIRELTQFLLRGPSTLSEGERELIATLVSHKNGCRFCATAHSAAAEMLLSDPDLVSKIKENIAEAGISDKMKALLVIASQVQESGKHVTPESVRRAREAGASDVEIHDTVLIAALFCLYNRYVDGLATVTPEEPEFYQGLARRIVGNGYKRPVQGYDHLKNSPH